MKNSCLIVVCITFFACSKNQDKAEDNGDKKTVAKAGTEHLFSDDLKETIINTGNKKDSAFYVKKTIEQWATESLFYQEALTKLEKEEIDIDKQVEAYRRELVNYIYSTRIIEANLDTTISKSEIEDYYNTHRDNFILKENIVKVNYIKIPNKATGLEKIKRLLITNAPSDVAQLKQLCAQNAENYFLNDSTWLYIDEIKKEIPALKNESDLNLGAGRIVQFTDDTYYYYLKIKDVKIKNALSPINFETQNIKKFIINNRKAQLIIQYKQLLLEKAKASKSFETY